ncbi:hypothetical protein C0036_26965, partial [Streptomyces sp. DJ]
MAGEWFRAERRPDVSVPAAARRRAAGTGRTPPSDIHPVLRRTGAPPAALDLLAQAHRGLEEA